MGELRVVDNRGLKCPLPVINTKKALDELPGRPLVSIVDNETARDNVRTFAESAGYEVIVQEKGENEFHVIIGRKGETADIAGSSSETKSGRDVRVVSGQVYVIGTNRLGSGDDELGELLMRSFIYALSEYEPPPKTLVFLNSGVYLTTRGSQVLDSLEALARKGCELLSCGTCLDFYGLKDELRVGRVTNMYEIVDIVSRHEKVMMT